MTPAVETSAPSDKVNWAKLSFDYSDTNCHIKYTWNEQSGWDNGTLVTSPYLNVHVSATALNYGQQCFEGVKAFRCKDNKVRLFRPKENSARLTRSALRLGMVPPSKSLFLSACYRLVKENLEFVPPIGSGGSLYLRPLLLGSGPQLGLAPAKEFTFIVYAVPVAPYYAASTVKGLKALIPEDFDRAAPMGTGSVKAGGNYAPSLVPTTNAKKQGYDVLLFLDAKTRTYIEEFATSNFLAIATKDASEQYTLVAPESDSILPSITTMSLIDLARSIGWNVERRPVPWQEVEGNNFTEIAAAGTAVILTPVSEIQKGEVCVRLANTTGLGEGFQILYDRIQAIQTGDMEDEFGWMSPREGVAAWNGDE